MKNQNPQEILNEILLRMKYEVNLTLSDNIKNIVVEQSSSISGEVPTEKNEEPTLYQKIQAVGKDAVESWDVETTTIITPFGEIKVPVGTKEMFAQPNQYPANLWRNCKEYDPNFDPDSGQYGYITRDGQQVRVYCPTNKFFEDWFTKNPLFGFQTPDGMQWTVVMQKQKGLPITEFWKISSAPELFKNTSYKDSRGWGISGYYNCLPAGDTIKCIPYDDDIMTPKSFTEKYLPILIQIASAIISLIPGIGWIGLMVVIGLDLTAAGIQLYYGDTIGASLSVLLSLVPFIGALKSISKYPSSVYNNLAKKFANATSEDEVIRIFAGLDDAVERKAMADLLTGPGVIQQSKWQYQLAQEVNSTAKNQFTKFIKNREKASEIIKQTKKLSKEGKIIKDKVPVWATTGMKSAAAELGISGPIIYAEIKRQPDVETLTAKTQEYQVQKFSQAILDDVKNEKITFSDKPKEERIKSWDSLDTKYDSTYVNKKTDSLQNETNQSIATFWDD
jgi:hypothetical protein